MLAFAVLSLLLAAVGLFGVLSYIVSQRTTEIGVRIAIGAQRSQVLALMLSDGLRPASIGLLLGLAGGVGASEMIGSPDARSNYPWVGNDLDPASRFIFSHKRTGQQKTDLR